MAITPKWVKEAFEEDYPRQLFVINHAWKKGGERIECFVIVENDEGDITGLEWQYHMGGLKDTTTEEGFSGSEF